MKCGAYMSISAWARIERMLCFGAGRLILGKNEDLNAENFNLDAKTLKLLYVFVTEFWIRLKNWFGPQENIFLFNLKSYLNFYWFSAKHETICTDIRISVQMDDFLSDIFKFSICEEKTRLWMNVRRQLKLIFI